MYRLFKICIRQCDTPQGKSGEIIQAILPILLEDGIVHRDNTIRLISLQTISQMVSSAGNLLKPSLAVLIPALLTSIGELEDANLTYLRNATNSSEMQETIDNAVVQLTKQHFSADTVTKVTFICIILFLSTVDLRKNCLFWIQIYKS